MASFYATRLQVTTVQTKLKRRDDSRLDQAANRQHRKPNLEHSGPFCNKQKCIQNKMKFQDTAK